MKILGGSGVVFLLVAIYDCCEFSNDGLMTPNGQGLLQGWNSLLVRPEPLLIKDLKVQDNK